MIAERLTAKLSRDFGTADMIQTDLVARGVFVHDGIKEWRSDGIPYGDFSERRNPRGNPGRTAGSRSSYEAAYMKSSYSAEVEGVGDDMIDKLVAERLTFKLQRDFEKADAIREGLRARYNVLIDDRLKMWSVGGDFGEEHNARRDLAHQFSTRGYIKSASSIALSPEDETYIQEQLDQRATAKRDRDFRTADDIRENLLQQYDVSVDDKMKLWSVGGAFEEKGGRQSNARGVYTRRGGGNLSEEAVAEIQDLLTERYHHKRDRNFDEADAIRDDLEARFDVRIDDRSSEWRIETDEYFPASTGNLSEESVELVNEKLRERFQCKRDRDYDAADAIRDELGETFGVVVDDRTKEWKVEAMEEPQYSVPYDKKEDVVADLDDEDDEDEENVVESAVQEEKIEEDEEEEEIEADDADGDPEVEDSILTEEELSSLTVVALKEKLRDVGLPVSGKKAELVARLLTQ